VRYLPPFEVIKRPVEISSSQGQVTATVSYEDLLGLIKHLLSTVEVDENWYVAQYPDVAQAIAQGRTASARQHFIDNGYFEGRLPFLIPVEEHWYLGNYPDVAACVATGSEPSAQAHFIQSGYREGRLPHPAPAGARQRPPPA
jgi:hypothetical protein